VLELHLQGDEDDSSTVTFNGQSLDYVVAEQDATMDWSVIREVKL
jgi:hypothetical protein